MVRAVLKINIMNTHTICSQVLDLNLPLGQYAVVGSGAMSVHGIREHKDIDLLVANELYRDLQDRGWKRKSIRSDFEVIVSGIAEASPEMITYGTYNPDIHAVIQRADIIDSVAFMQLADLVDFKTSLGREKDVIDIALIKKYLEQTN
jgi:hypothetical protein